MWNAEIIPEAVLQIRNILMQIQIRVLLFTLIRIRIRIPLPFALMRMRFRIRFLSFNLLRIQIRILPLTVFQIWSLQCSNWPSKTSTFSLWCGSGSCFPFWCECGSGSSFPNWCASIYAPDPLKIFHYFFTGCEPSNFLDSHWPNILNDSGCLLLETNFLGLRCVRKEKCDKYPVRRKNWGKLCLGGNERGTKGI